MLEWQVTEDEELFLDPLEEQPPRRWRIPWRLLLALVLGCTALAFGLFRWRIAEREREMRADLTEFVTLEERARLFGLEENQNRLLVSNAPDEWTERYLDTFLDPDETYSVETEVGRIEWDGETAVAIVYLNGDPQLRRYRLTDDGWRRAPLRREDWTQREGMELPFAYGAALSFTPRDEAFARALLEAQPELERTVGYWSGVQGRSFMPDEVAIQAVEFREPILRANAERIVLNSPLLVPDSPLVTGEGAVRLALAQELFDRARHAAPQPQGYLPGRNYIVSAAHSLAAMRWALTPEQQEPLRAEWRTRVGDTWNSPFFTGASAADREINLLNPTRTEAAALLTADFIYQAHGVDALTAIVREVPTASSWDTVLQKTLGQWTATLDAEAEAYARGGMGAVAQVDDAAPASSAVAVPLVPTRIEPHPTQQNWFLATVPGADEPIVVEAQSAAIDGPEEMPNLVECATLYSDLQIQGDWIEPGRHLYATSIQARGEIVPPPLPEWTPPPTDTIAYLLDHVPDEGTYDEQALFALRADGATVPLARLTNILNVTPLRQKPGEPVRLLLQRQRGSCDQSSWIAIYEPSTGVARQWSADFGQGNNYINVLSHPDSAQVLIFTYPMTGTATIYAQFDPASGIFEPYGELEGQFYPAGWLPATEEVLLFGGRDDEARFIALDTGETTRTAALAGEPTWSMHLTPDGRFLSYVTATQETDPPASNGPGNYPIFRDAELHVHSLASGTEQELSFPGEQLILWYNGTMSDQLLLIAGPPGTGETWVPEGGRVLIVDPMSPQDFSVAFQVGEDEIIGWTLACSDGRILYTVATEEGNQHEIRLWSPDGDTGINVTLEQSVTPLACP